MAVSRSGSVPSKRADAIAVVEAAYVLAHDDRAWLEGISRHVLGAFDRGLGVVSYIAEVRSGRVALRTLCRLGNAPPEEAIVANMEHAPNQAELARNLLAGGIRTISEDYGHDPAVMKHHERTVEGPSEYPKCWRSWRATASAPRRASAFHCPVGAR